MWALEPSEINRAERQHLKRVERAHTSPPVRCGWPKVVVGSRRVAEPADLRRGGCRNARWGGGAGSRPSASLVKGIWRAAAARWSRPKTTAPRPRQRRLGRYGVGLVREATVPADYLGDQASLPSSRAAAPALDIQPHQTDEPYQGVARAVGRPGGGGGLPLPSPTRGVGACWSSDRCGRWPL